MNFAVSRNAAGSPLAPLGAGRDRYGAVDVIPVARNGFVGVRVIPHGGFDVAVWDDELTAWDRGSSDHEIVETMRRWQHGCPPRPETALSR